MPLSEVDGPAGAPWERPLAGSLDRLVVESELLAGNPLGDPTRRPLWVYRPPGIERDHPRELPAVYVIQGFTGQLDMWANRVAWDRHMVERLDEMFAAGDCPDALVVFVDCWTTYGGSQFLDSTSTGPYQSYLCDEVVPFVDAAYPTAADRERRGIAGKSSGGYGAMVVPMMRPDLFSALASHAGDALFESCYLADFRRVARQLRDDYEGSYDVFFERLAETDPVSFERHGKPLEMYGYAACYSPDPDRPGKALLPFEVETGRVVDEVWERWLALDPVRMAPGHAEALRSMRRIYLDAGRKDEWFLDLGAQAFAGELDKLGVEHTLELFDGKHGGLTYRYAPAIRELVLALAG
jgi:enterochelin esterase-like enzyme